MNKCNNILLAITIQVLFVANFCKADISTTDSVAPKVGQSLPEFNLHNLALFKTTNPTSNDFKGKWLFLDFWFMGCSSCIHSFPKVNSIYKKYRSELEWIMIGVNETKYNKGIELLYEKFRVKHNLEMPFAFDSVFVKRWDIHSMPHILIVDPDGIVRFITDGRDLTIEKVGQLLDNKEVSFYSKGKSVTVFEQNQLPGELGEDASKGRLICFSVLAKWNGEKQYVINEIERWVTWPEEHLKKGFMLSMVPLYSLFNYAYIGKWNLYYGDSLYNLMYPLPILEIADSSKFEYDYTSESGKGLYNYSLKIPISEISKENIMLSMQQDLKRWFNYDVIFECREMPVWKLIAGTKARKKLESSGENKFATEGNVAMGFTLKNYPANRLVNFISFYLSEKDQNSRFIDETGIISNIDITIDADMTDFSDVKKALALYDLDLVKSRRKMMVMIIKDSQP